MPTEADKSSVRLDRWLWAARFYKTRQLATAAVRGGKVEVNKSRAKPARTIRIGDSIRLRRGAYIYAVTVIELSDHRGPATVAQTLYRETADSLEQRRKLALQLRSEAQGISYERFRPSGRIRRKIRRTKRGGP